MDDFMVVGVVDEPDAMILTAEIFEGDVYSVVICCSGIIVARRFDAGAGGIAFKLAEKAVRPVYTQMIMFVFKLIQRPAIRHAVARFYGICPGAYIVLQILTGRIDIKRRACC